MQSIEKNGITYKNRKEASEALCNGELSGSDYIIVVNHFEAQGNLAFVQDNYEFTDAQMKTFTDEQINILNNAMVSHIEYEDMKSAYDELKSWAEDMPYLY